MILHGAGPLLFDCHCLAVPEYDDSGRNKLWRDGNQLDRKQTSIMPAGTVMLPTDDARCTSFAACHVAFLCMEQSKVYYKYGIMIHLCDQLYFQNIWYTCMITPCLCVVFLVFFAVTATVSCLQMWMQVLYINACLSVCVLRLAGDQSRVCPTSCPNAPAHP